MQVDLIRYLTGAGERALCTVGDAQQSIYRFRLADPLIFTDKYEKYSFLPDAREGDIMISHLYLDILKALGLTEAQCPMPPTIDYRTK